MKVLWLSHLIPYPPKGGVLQRSYNLVREIAKYHDVYLLAFTQSDILRTMFPDVEQGRLEARHALQSYCKRVEFVPIPCEQTKSGKQVLALKSLFTRDPYTINWLKSDVMQRIVDEWQNEVKFDLVHFDTISLAPYKRSFPHTRSVLDHHNIESHMMMRRSALEKNWVKKFYFLQEGLKLKHYENHMLGKFDMHITCSQLDSERLRKIDPTVLAEEIPNGVDIEYFHPMETPQVTKSLVFAGGLKWYPNQKAMLYFAKEVWPLLKREIPDVSMDVIGQSPPDALVELSARDSAFRVHGFVDDVRPYLDRAAVYVCPITDGGGTKLKILDALAMGKAVVADPVACEGINVTANENVLFASSPEEYLKAIRHLLDNPDIRKKAGESARQLILEQYSYANIGKKLSHIYRQIVEMD